MKQRQRTNARINISDTMYHRYTVPPPSLIDLSSTSTAVDSSVAHRSTISSITIYFISSTVCKFELVFSMSPALTRTAALRISKIFTVISSRQLHRAQQCQCQCLPPLHY